MIDTKRARYGRLSVQSLLRATCAGLALLLLTATTAGAAPRYMKGRFAVGVALGVNQPLPDFDTILKTGGALDITGEYYLSNAVSLGAYLEGVINNPKDEYKSPDFNANARFASLNAVARVTFQTAKLQPYLLIGAGGYNREVEYWDPLTNQTGTQGGTTVPGFLGGGGAFYPLSHKVDMFAEVTYHQMLLEEDATVADTQAYLNVSLGIRGLFGGIVD